MTQKNIISNGSKINPLFEILFGKLKIVLVYQRDFALKGHFSLPIEFYRGFRMPKILRNYCEEMYLGYFLKKKV